MDLIHQTLEYAQDPLGSATASSAAAEPDNEAARRVAIPLAIAAGIILTAVCSLLCYISKSVRMCIWRRRVRDVESRMGSGWVAEQDAKAEAEAKGIDPESLITQVKIDDSDRDSVLSSNSYCTYCATWGDEIDIRGEHGTIILGDDGDIGTCIIQDVGRPIHPYPVQ